MKKWKVSLPFVLGISLIAASVVFVFVFQMRMYKCLETSRRIVEKMSEILPDGKQNMLEIYQNSSMPIIEIENEDYVALLEIPSFGITLPVADKWDGNKFFNVPSRFWGSSYDNTLIIGGTDIPQQFAFCDKIEHGAQVKVTDMTGGQFHYNVSCIERAKYAKSQWLAEEDWDLTLFCHDFYSMEYIAVRCTVVYNERACEK